MPNSVIYKIMWVGKVTTFQIGRAASPTSEFGVAGAAPRLRQGY